MITGIFTSIIAGIFNGSFAAPAKRIKNWEWENTWFVYALVSLLLLPVITAFITVPGLLNIYNQAGSSLIIKTLVTGFLYGIGTVTFGLGLHMAGLSLGNSLMIGIISITGSLIPMLLISPESILTIGGGILLLAMVVTVIGIIYCAQAGTIRARLQESGEGPGNRKKSYKTAMVVCIVSGVFSSMLNISLVFGQPIAQLAQASMSGAFSSYRAYNAVWAITLSGAFIPYTLYCIYLFFRNKSLTKYKGTTRNLPWAVLMGFLWFLSITLYGVGASNLGKLGTTIGWLILMACTVIVGNLWGWLTGEWENAPQKAQQKMKVGLLLLFLSVVMVAVARFYI
jgi:L-rhamnose-H+ transport protein